ncbi:porin [Vibrio barjaei]|uniref:porin n=1 Tax=Vibrio barjaei TaxID=1676683 RepID=UPI002283566D|nr:porin [Vibrio barjaei]MCY9870410.1 porin [Vibrio barjaei]
MKKSIISLAVLASMTAGQALAINLYDMNGTKVNMNGAVGVQMSSYDYDTSSVLGNDQGFGLNNDNVVMEDPGSFVGFEISHEVGKHKAFTKLEWDINMGTQGEKQFSTLEQRQAYVGVDLADAGRFSIGKQESPYMKTDKGYYAYWVGGLNMMQSDELGSRRTDNTFVWERDLGNLYLGAQLQTERSHDAVSFGNGLNFGSVLDAQSTLDVKNGFGLATTYTTAHGTYLALAYNQANDINGDFVDLLGDGVTLQSATDAEVKQVAFAVEHHFLNGEVSVSARFEHFQAKDGAGAFEIEAQNFGLGANAYLSPDVRVYGGIEGAKDTNELTGSTNSEVMMYNIGAAWAPVPWAEVYAEAYYDDVELNNSYNIDTGAMGASSKGTHLFVGAAVIF